MMPLIARIVAERRAIVLPLIALALVNLGLYIFVVYPLSVRVSTLASRAAQAARLKAAADKEYADARGIATGRERADLELREFYKHVLPADVAGARRSTYARLAQLAHDAGLRADRRSYEADTTYKGSLAKIKITMVLEGDYAGVRQFIHSLETSPEFVVIEHVSLAERPQSENVLTLSLDLATYYQPEPHGS